MKQTIHLTAQVPETLHGARFDKALATLFPEHSRTRLKSWIEQGSATVNGQIRSPKEKVFVEDELLIQATIALHTTDEPQDIALDVIYEDSSILVINKPAGLVVHPAAGNRDHTLLNALLHHSEELKQLPRAGIVHRLDKETSGLLVIAKTLEAHTHLVLQLQNRSMGRVYDAFVLGDFVSGGTIDAPIGRHSTRRTEMAVTASGKPATTHYRIEHRYSGITHLKVQLESGRTHQIRVHFAHLKHPLIGDPVYGGRTQLPKGASPEIAKAISSLRRQALHACSLHLVHPDTEEMVTFHCKLAKDLQELQTILQKK